MTREGGLVVAELKRETVNIGTLAQALHYVLMLGAMDLDAVLKRLTLSEEAKSTLTASYENDGTPDFSIMLIGTSRVPELDRATAFLSRQGLNVPVKIVTFTPFLDTEGRVFLVRDVEDHELEPSDLSGQQRRSRHAKVEWVQEMARVAGVGEVVESFIQTASDLGLRIRPWPKSLTIVPPFTRGRTLLYLGPKGAGQVHFGYSPENLTELYGADVATVRQRLGENWVNLSPEDAQGRIQEFASLMQGLQQSDEVVTIDSDAHPLVERFTPPPLSGGYGM